MQTAHFSDVFGSDLAHIGFGGGKVFEVDMCEVHLGSPVLR